MNCEEVNINMLDLAEGSLDRGMAYQLREHIDNCKECKDRYSFIEGAIGQIKSEREISVSQEFGDKILARIKISDKPIFYNRSIFIPLAAAAVIVFGIFTGIFISGLSSGGNTGVYADLPDEYYYTNEIHLETIEGFFLTNHD